MGFAVKRMSIIMCISQKQSYYYIYISLFSYIYKVQHNGYLQSRLKKYKNKMII